MYTADFTKIFAKLQRCTGAGVKQIFSRSRIGLGVKFNVNAGVGVGVGVTISLSYYCNVH